MSRPQTRADHEPTERHLVVRVGRLGDMVMITPALQALSSLPGVPRLVLLTSPVGADLLDGAFPYVEEIRVLDRSRWRRFGWSRRVGRWIRGEAFDRVWLFESAPRYRRLVRGADCPVRQIEPDGETVEHFAERCARLIEPPPNPLPWASLPVSTSALDEAGRFLEGAGIPSNAQLIGIHPGFSGAAKALGAQGSLAHSKAWPIERWAALAGQLDAWGREQKPDVKVVMTLTPGEVDLGRRIVAASDGAVELLPPTPDLETYAAVLKRYAVLVAPDTGPGHLAAAVGTPVVSLFARKDPADCAPYAPPDRLRVLRAEDTDRPESGLAAIGSEEVAAAVRELWMGRERIL